MNSLSLEENCFPTVAGPQTSMGQSFVLPSHFSLSLSFSTWPWSKGKRGSFLILTWTWYCDVSCMMTLELEYFFLCSGWRDRCHVPQREGPSLVGLDPQGPRRRGELGWGCCFLNPAQPIGRTAGWKVALTLLWGPLAWSHDRPHWGPEAPEDRDLFRVCWGKQPLTEGLFVWGQETQSYVMEAAHFTREGVPVGAFLSYQLPLEYSCSLELLLPRPPASSI